MQLWYGQTHLMFSIWIGQEEIQGVQVWIPIYSIIILPFPSHLVVPSPTPRTFRLTHAKGKIIWWLSLREGDLLRGRNVMVSWCQIIALLVETQMPVWSVIFSPIPFHNFWTSILCLSVQQVYMFIFIYELKILPIFFGIFQLHVCLRENPFSSLRKSGLWNSLLLTR